MPARFIRSPALAPFLFTLGILAFWIFQYGPHWPYRDGFIYFHALDELTDGRLSASRLLISHDNQHPIAFQLVVAILFLKAFPGNVWPMIAANAVMLWLSAVVLYMVAAQSLTSYWHRLALACLICASTLIGSQTSSLLWEFQIWFYSTLLLLALNIALTERFGLKAYPVVILFCIFATGNEAQGAFLWLIGAVHILYIAISSGKRGDRVAGLAILASHIIIFSVLALIMNNLEYRDAPRDVFNAHFIDKVVYGVQLVGGGFGVRNQNAAFAFGVLSLVAWGMGLVFAIRRRFSCVIDRVAFLVSAVSLMWCAAFTVGRASFGIAWAFGEFHASLMLIPLYSGIGMYSVSMLTQSRIAWRAAGACLGIFVIAPVVTGIPFAIQRSEYIRDNSLLDVALDCTGSSVKDPFMRSLCGINNRSADASSILRLPTYYEQIIAGEEGASDALHALWRVYLSRQDLRDAFSPSDPNFAMNLLRWGAVEASHERKDDSQALSQYASTFQSLVKRLGL